MRTSASLRLLAMGLTVAGVSLLTACGGDAPAPTATAPTTLHLLLQNQLLLQPLLLRPIPTKS